MTPSRRSGFALLWVIVMMCVMMVLAVATATSVAVVSDHDRVSMAKHVIMRVMDSTRFSIVRFQADIGEYPRKLSQLSNTLTATDRDICGALYSATEREEWSAQYSTRVITTAGLWLGIGTARDSLAKDPVAGTPSVVSPHALVMLIDGVDQRDAQILNMLIDPEGEATPSTLGRVRWDAVDAQGRVLLRFRKTITEC
jgi:hypothetical protein